MSNNQIAGERIKPKSKFYYWAPLFCVPIILWGFYWYVGFDFRIIKMALFIFSIALLLIYSSDILHTRKGWFEHDVSLFIFSFLISILSCLIYWGQSPVLTFRAGISTLSILFFFTLKRRNVDIDSVERLCIVFATIYAALWLYALSMAPFAVFGNADEVNDARGFFRINSVKGIDMVALLYCISLYKISNSSKKWIWILVAIGTFVLIFLSLTRILIGAAVAVTIMYLLRKKSVFLIVIVAFIAFGGTELLTRNDAFNMMSEMTVTQFQEDANSDMRHPEYEGAFNLFPFHVGTVLFGNGAPHVESSYGQFEENLKSQFRFNRSDAGFVGIYTTYGLFMFFLLIRLFIRVIKLKTPPECVPYKLFIIFLFISNLTMYVFWSYGIAFMLCLYLLDKYRNWDMIEQVWK